MSRSLRKTPIRSMTTNASDKAFKVNAHRAQRRNVRSLLPQLLHSDDRRFHPKAYGDPWGSRKDGKSYAPDADVELRK